VDSKHRSLAVSDRHERILIILQQTDRLILCIGHVVTDSDQVIAEDVAEYKARVSY